MSWTIKPPPDGSEEKELFDKAIRRAVSSNVLMFCSSNDAGDYSEADYPAASNREKIFRIGASQDNGLVFPWAGRVDKLDYIFPGVEVFQRKPKGEPSLESWKSETGSSVATALGAGLAALLIYCVKIGAIHTSGIPGGAATGVNSKDVEEIKKHQAMREAFNDIGFSATNKFIEVWKFFDKRTEDLKERPLEQDSMETVADMARSLVRKS
jgi:hypothetical protein